MQNLGPLDGDRDFTVAEILDVAQANRQETSSEARRTFYALWLDGYFADSTGRRSNVLGVSIGDTEVIVMFKPVISGLSFLSRSSRRRWCTSLATRSGWSTAGCR